MKSTYTQAGCCAAQLVRAENQFYFCSVFRLESRSLISMIWSHFCLWLIKYYYHHYLVNAFSGCRHKKSQMLANKALPNWVLCVCVGGNWRRLKASAKHSSISKKIYGFLIIKIVRYKIKRRPPLKSKMAFVIQPKLSHNQWSSNLNLYFIELCVARAQCAQLCRKWFRSTKWYWPSKYAWKCVLWKIIVTLQFIRP